MSTGLSSFFHDIKRTEYRLIFTEREVEGTRIAGRMRRVQTIFLKEIKCIRHFHSDVTARRFGHDLTTQVCGKADAADGSCLSSIHVFSRLLSQCSAHLCCLRRVQ